MQDLFIKITIFFTFQVIVQLLPPPDQREKLEEAFEDVFQNLWRIFRKT